MSRAVIQATWDDVPHLSADQKKALWDSIPVYQREARSKGVPQLGSGAIYPVAESEVTCAPFQLPSYWPRSYGMDVGWNRTAAIFGAHDRETDTIYYYHEYYRGQAEPSIHAAGVRALAGDWMPGVIDPASRGRSQKDGDQLIHIYRDLGLNITPANNAREAGIYEVWQRLTTGRAKIFTTLVNTLQEYRLYRRDEKGAVVKENDHLMDALRYHAMSGVNVAALMPNYIEKSGFARQGGQHKVDYDPLARSVALPGHLSDYDPFRR